MLRLLTVVVVILCLCHCSLRAQDHTGADHDARSYWNQRSVAEQAFVSALQDVIENSGPTDSASAAAAIRQRFIIRRDPQRQYIFMPSEDAKDLDQLLAEWPEDIRQAALPVLNRHAEALFQLAADRAEQGDGATAFQLLHEVLFFSPNHQPARGLLGHRLMGEAQDAKWRIKSDRLKTKRATRPLSRPDWAVGSYNIVSTPNFRIVSRASETETEILAGLLERWHDIWRQVFFEYFQRSASIRNWFNGKGNYRPPSGNFEVVFFANRDDYVAGLAADVPGIEASTGYYHDGQQTSYFYASDDPSVRDTWRHELTHQLFQETKRSVLSPFGDQFLWLGEGIAMYFESVTDFGSYVTLGGFDARRLQYARLRRLTQQFRVPLSQLSPMSRSQFQSQDQIAWVYSQAAGMTHYLMTADHGSMRKPLIEFLQLSYQGKLKPGSFEKLIGRSNQEIDAAYPRFLKIQPGQLSFLSAPETRKELALGGASLQENSLQPLGRCTELQWLDLSGCDVSGNRLSPLKHCRKLKQLFLAGSRVDRDGLQVIAQLPLRELDLSRSGTTDTDLASLAESESLKSLDVSGTRVTAAGIRAFKTRRPDIELIEK